MKNMRFILLTVVGGVGMGALAQWALVAPAVAETQPGMAATATAMVLPAIAGEEFAYVGSGKCKKCHIKEFKSWEETVHSKAFDTLKPNQKADAKTAAKLDPAKDYTQDAACLACHTVGMGKKDGFAAFPAGDAEKEKAMKDLLGVGCESCHGAGGGYMDLHDEIKKSKRQYKHEEMLAKGMIVPDAAACKTCHNEKSPTFKSFNFDEAKAKGVHAVEPLKQRAE